MAQSSELTGGAGFDYEGHVAAYFLSALLTSDVRPPRGMPIICVGLQQSPFGSPLDDVIITFDDPNRSKLNLQVKRSLRVTASKSNKDFREIVKNSWLTFKDPKNTDLLDHYGAATGTISSKSLRTVRKVCEAAQLSHDEVAFFSRNSASGTASKLFDNFIKTIRTTLTDNGIVFTDSELYNFLKNFVILDFDIQSPHSIANTDAINRLSQILTAPHRANDLWERLKNIAREGSGAAATFDKDSLKRRLYPLFTFEKDNIALNDPPKANRFHPEQNPKHTADAKKCDVAVSNLMLNDGLLYLTAVVVTDDYEKLANEVTRWKKKLKRSSLLISGEDTNIENETLTTIFKNPHFASILLQDLATTELSIYIYYAKKSDSVNEWEKEKLEQKIITTPLFHRLSHRLEIIENIYSEIPNIEQITNAATIEVLNKYRRHAHPKIAKSYAHFRSELLQISDLIAHIAANYISNGATYPKEYITYIRTRIRYAENIVTGEKHVRDKNPFA